MLWSCGVVFVLFTLYFFRSLLSSFHVSILWRESFKESQRESECRAFWDTKRKMSCKQRKSCSEKSFPPTLSHCPTVNEACWVAHEQPCSACQCHPITWDKKNKKLHASGPSETAHTSVMKWSEWQTGAGSRAGSIWRIHLWNISQKSVSSRRQTHAY